MSGDPIRVEVFGKFRVLASSKPVTQFRTKRAEEVLARLTLQRSRGMTRETLSADLWPESDPSDRLNNLRPALSYVRSALGFDPFEGSDRDIALNRLVESDWEMAQRQERIIAASTSEDDRLVNLLVLDGLIQQPLLEGWGSPWIEPFRSQHFERRLRILEQIAELFGSRGQWESALEVTRKMLLLNATHEPAILLRLRFLGHLGNIGQARRDFAEYKRNLSHELGLLPRPTVEKLAAKVLRGNFREANLRPLTTTQKELIQHMISMLVVEEPDRILYMLASPKINWEVVLHGPELRQWLELLIKSPGVWTPERSGVAKRLLQFYWQDFDLAALIQLAQQLLTSEVPEDKVAALNYLGLASREIGRLDQSTAFYEQAILLAHGISNDYLVSVSRANLASTYLASQQWDSARQEFVAVEKVLETNVEPNGRFSTASLKLSRVGCEVLAGDLPTAKKLAKAWRQFCISADLSSFLGEGDCTMGLIAILDGDSRGLAKVADGIEYAIASRRRIQMVTAARSSLLALEAIGRLQEAKAISHRLAAFVTGRESGTVDGSKLPEILSDIISALSYGSSG